jgi:hypothetical protein
MPPGAGGPVEVGIVVLQPETMTVTAELSGRTVANVIAEIRPQVGGVIQQRGTLVLPAPNPVAMTTTSIPSGIALLYADGKLAMWDSVL